MKKLITLLLVSIPLIIGIPIGFIYEGIVAGFYYGQEKLANMIKDIQG